MTKLLEFSPLTKLVNDGYKTKIKQEVDQWNNRIELERYPLSPSQIGKCGLKLGRDLAHFLGIANYPRTYESREPRVQRIFGRGDLIEDALIADFEEHAKLKVVDKQKEVTLFRVTAPNGSKYDIKGGIDGLVLEEKTGVRILVDYKSKGAFYSSGFKDSIAQFFEELRETGFVVSLGDGCYAITDVAKIFEIINMDDFFVDYLLQLNSYAFSRELEGKVDFVALYYENKNTCEHYEVRWEPKRELFDYAKNKFQYIFETVHSAGPEAIPKEFSLGSAKCRLCEYNATCYGKFEPKAPDWKKVGKVPPAMETDWLTAAKTARVKDIVESTILTYMEKEGLTHFQTDDGMMYERRFLKSPKPHYELRLARPEKENNHANSKK